MFNILLLSLSASFGVVHGTYAGDSNARQFDTELPGFQLRVGGEKYYVWGSYETPAMTILGQTLHGNLEMWGYGVGVRHTWDKFGVFAEFGIFDPKIDPHKGVQDEVVNRMLMNHHGERDQWFRNTTMAFNQGYGARIGGTYKLRPHLYGSVAYRFFNGVHEYDGWTHSDGSTAPPVFLECVRPTCDWWQEGGLLKYDAFEIGLFLEF